MLRYYHSGAFIKKKWSCCHKTEKHYDSGCASTYISEKLSGNDILYNGTYHCSDSNSHATKLDVK